MARTKPPASVSAGVGTRPVIGGKPSVYAAQVLDIVDRIPPGKVLTYGDIAEMIGSGSGRVVGAAMSRHGHEVAWHRVVLSSGHPNPAGPIEAMRRLKADGTPIAKGGERVDLALARWDGMGVRLLAATEPLLTALRDDRTLFGELIGSPAPQGWPEFPEAIGFTLEYLKAAADADRRWSMQFFLEAATGRLLGSGGYAAPPSQRCVEIGYEIAPEFRRRGFATAAAKAMIERAVASGEVDHVIAHTLPGPNPSMGVLVTLGFAHTHDLEDPETGVVWEWRWTRADGRLAVR